MTTSEPLYPINPDFLAARKLWTDALRSGKYQQCTRRLCKIGEGYCCLGIAAEVYQQHVGGLTVEDKKAPFCEEYNRNFNGYDAIIPPEVAAWLNISQNGALAVNVDSGELAEFPDRYGCLAECNDHGKMPFTKIADIIETTELRPFDEKQLVGNFNKPLE